MKNSPLKQWKRTAKVYNSQQLNYASLKAGQHRLSNPLVEMAVGPKTKDGAQDREDEDIKTKEEE